MTDQKVSIPQDLLKLPLWGSSQRCHKTSARAPSSAAPSSLVTARTEIPALPAL